ncbi:MAG: hypothetical protein M3N95_04525 [Actinomycetota bacterium]|nr:hypothetical protein [Actinomycetota bacterium]
MAALETTASLATAGGTLILAIATFASIRASNRSARTAERALLAGLRPVLASSRMQDEEQKIHFQDGKWIKVGGGGAVVEVSETAIYFAISLRNVGSGMAVLHGWTVEEGNNATPPVAHDPSQFRRLTRDLYIPPGEMGFWQGALRDPSEPEFASAREAVRNGSLIHIELLYGDHEGGQRVITGFALVPRGENGGYLTSTSRHWNIDRGDPR